MHLAQAVTVTGKKSKTVVHLAQAGTVKILTILYTWHRLSLWQLKKNQNSRAPGTGWHR